MDKSIAKRLLPIRFIRAMFALAIVYRSLIRGSQLYFVHSLIFAVPLWLLKRRYCIFIHGTDDRFLHTWWGRSVCRQAIKVFGIGFSFRDPAGSQLVHEIPNIYSPRGSRQVLKTNDLVFVLRSAAVKNPTYPILLAEHTRNEVQLKILVVGVAPGELAAEDLARLVALQRRGVDIRYLGRQPYECVLQLMSESRALMIPSLSEGVPKVALEALSQGIAVLVNSDLRLPADLSSHIERVSLDDWTAIERFIIQNRSGNVNFHNMEFAERYLSVSMSTILSSIKPIYDSLNARVRS
jgi:hypothetical protein